MEFNIFLKGFFVTFSLIVAIGAQNAYVLKLGLLKQHVLKAIIFCTLSDFLLISVGVLGLGVFIQGKQIFINSIAIFGMFFLVFYAFLSFKSAFENRSLKIDNEVKTNPLKKVLLMLFVFTYFNPHTYLDTVLLVGGIGANIESDYKLIFLFGAVSASATWFCLLGYGARVLIPLFRKPVTWKILDISIGCVMLFIAYSLHDLVKF